MNERIKIIRKNSGLSQSDFGKRIGLTRDTVANIEGNRIEIRDVFIKAICREFDVNESWLRDGSGEMLVSRSKDNEIASLLSGLKDGSFKKRFVSMLASLSEPEWQVLEKIAISLAAPAQDEAESWQEEKARLMEEYGEMLEEEKRQERQGSSSGRSGSISEKGIA